MATENYYFSGEAIWCKVHAKQKDKKYNRYTIGVFLDDDSMERFKESGIQTLPKFENYKEKSGRQYYQFAREEKSVIKGELVDFGTPHIFLAKDQIPDAKETPRFEGEVGNGSKVTVKVAVYDTVKGKGHRLESVRVDELVEFERGADAGVDSPW